MTGLTFQQSRVLVVGGAGFVGSNLIHALLEEGVAAVTVIDNLLSSEAENIPSDPRVRFVFGSISDDRVVGRVSDDYEFIFHLACYHGNQSSIADPLADHQNNALTSLKLFDRVKSFKSLKKLVYAAAACAVAEKTHATASATTEDQPMTFYHDSPYSISKIVGELYGNFYFQQHQLPIVKARFSNVYGPREILGAGQWRGTVHTVWRNVVPTFIWRALHQESLPIENGGEASRDFIYVADVSRGLMACALNGEPGEVYNLATGRETKILTLAEVINELTENKAPLEMHPARSWDRSGKRFGSTVKAKERLSFEARVELREGISGTVEWTRRNMEFIRSTISRHDKMMSQAQRERPPM